MEISEIQAMPPAVTPIGAEQVKKFTQVLEKYKAGKKQTESRIIASENWWKLRNTMEEQKETNVGADGGFRSVSGWLHNVIVSKHADAMEAYPEPNILPREEGDRAEARKLSAIIPCILEQNHFEQTYSDAMWQKFKTGTGVYKIFWDKNRLNGLGDIAVERVNLLNVYWEPGVTDIQQSRYFFHTELWDKDVLKQIYPELEGKLKGQTFISAKFLYDEHADTENKETVIEVYYHKHVGGRKTLQYCKYVNDVVLYATENIPEMAERGLYDHGRYPYEFDALFPIEGSPCGYGYVDICHGPQTEIDLLKTSFVKNAMVGATPRYFSRGDGSVNEDEFLDLSKPIVHVKNAAEDALRRIDYTPIDGSYLNLLDRTVQELRETSGNTETSTGNISSGVTAASAIAALQEASGKGSRDSTRTAYRTYSRIVEICIELIRQFYDLPRQFRILGEYGAEQYLTYTNADLVERHQGYDFGVDGGYHKSVFDVTVSAQKKNVYTKVTQNELAIQFFQLGFFNPQMTDQALLCLELMEFDGKDGVMQKVSKIGTVYDKLMHYMQLSMMLATAVRPDLVPVIEADFAAMASGAAPTALASAKSGGGEHPVVENARARSSASASPEGGRVTRKAGDR